MQEREPTATTSRMRGKVSVITGGASGIGAATAKRFVAEGGAVVIADLQADAGLALANALNNATFIKTDVTSETEIAAAVELAVSRFGRLDCMINNAGMVGAIGSISDTYLDNWNRTIAVLLTGVFLGIKHASRIMIPQRSGSIISLSSTAGILGGLGPHAYTAAKHGVVGLTKSAASELAQYGIRVNAIAPGGVHTPLLATAGLSDPEKALEMLSASSANGVATLPEDIADGLLFLASDASKQITGHTLTIDMGATTTGGKSNPFHAAIPSVLGDKS